MLIRDVMTGEPCTIEVQATLDRAMQLMDERDIRHLPVVQGESVVGVVSDRDLLEATGWEPARVRRADDPERPMRSIADVMHTPVTTVRPDDTVVMASVELLLNKVGCLPVVSDDRIVGILSERDLLSAWLIAVREGGITGETDPPAGRLMTRDLYTLHARATLGDAITLCREEEISHLPVVDEGELVGFVSDRDLKRALGRGCPEETPIDKVVRHEVVTLGEDALLRDAAELMFIRSISAVPIVTRGELVGIVTLTDVLVHCMESLRERDQPA